MTDIRPFLFPNYSLAAIIVLMILTALVLNIVYVPDTETLFVPFFFWEFSAIFLLTLAFVFFYETRKRGGDLKYGHTFYALVSFAGLYVVISLFATMKSILHVVQPFELDELFIRIEQFFHFGFLPTTLIDRMLHMEGLYSFLDFTYGIWFFWMYIYVSLVILGDPYGKLRERYVFCFAAVWFFIGNIAATLMASVGPIFLEDFFKPETSSAALNTLRDSADKFEAYSESKKHFAATFKNLIMEYMQNKTMVDANAASAMPSVHVAMAALMMFHARHVNRVVFIISILFFACIFIGSVLLCWHYAIDGYVAVLLTFGLWKLSAFLPVPQKPQKSAA